MSSLAFNVLVIGHKQHGKGTLAKIVNEVFNVPVMGTSRFSSEYMFNLMKDTHGYQRVEECYQDRGNHREYWFTKLREYNEPNLSQLLEDIYLNHALCEGLRHREEFEAAKAKAIFDLIIWVDASERLPLESPKSMQLTKNDAHLIVDNNADEATFKQRVIALFNGFIQPGDFK